MDTIEEIMKEYKDLNTDLHGVVRANEVEINWLREALSKAYLSGVESVIKEIFPEGLDDPKIDQDSYGWIVLKLKALTPNK